MSVLIDVKYGGYYMLLVTDKAAFVDFDQVGHKTAFESLETSKNLQILVYFSRQRTIKVLVILH